LPSHCSFPPFFPLLPSTLGLHLLPFPPSQLQIATAHGWHPIIGIEAMIEQGLAQQRMWARGDASVEVGCDASILGEDVEAVARQWVANMDECVFLFIFLTKLRLLLAVCRLHFGNSIYS
jgi:hypothetical protein